jgi:hypothetical protein
MSTWAKTRARHLAVIQSVEAEPLPDALHLTKNSKTGCSVDFPVHTTCCPTRVCMGSGDNSARCYALGGFMNFPNAVRQHALNQRLVDSLIDASPRTVKAVADRLWAQIPRGRNWLRWNGAGDLSPGACKVINALTRDHPDLLIWVISRRPDMIRLLADRAALRLLLSLDHSTPPATAQKLRSFKSKFKRAAVRFSYTRVSEEDKPPGDVAVVFNKHVGPTFNAWAHRKVCPASLPDTEHEGACDPCRRCFK